MELIIGLFLINVLRINAIHITKNIEDTTLVTKGGSEQLSKIDSKHIVNFTEIKPPLPLPGRQKCVDKICWWLIGGCYDNTTSSCYCPYDTVRIGLTCFEKLSLGDFCFYDQQCQTPNSVCSFSSFLKVCQCKSGYVRIFGRCYKTVLLGDYCFDSKQCKISNSECLNVCQCRYGYKDFFGKCERKDNFDYKPSIQHLDDGIIALFSIFVVIILVIIIASVTYCLRRRFGIQSRTQINEVSTIQPPPPPPYLTVQLSPENGLTRDNTTLQSQAIGSTLQDTQKPPSYEDAIRS